MLLGKFALFQEENVFLRRFADPRLDGQSVLWREWQELLLLVEQEMFSKIFARNSSSFADLFKNGFPEIMDQRNEGTGINIVGVSEMLVEKLNISGFNCSEDFRGLLHFSSLFDDLRKL